MVQQYGREGSEFTVNSPDYNTEGQEFYPEWGPHVTPLLSGGFVVVWTQGDPWGYYPGEYFDLSAKGQVYDAAGARVGAEFIVSIAGIQPITAHGVAALHDGGFVATFAGQDGVYAQIFGADGATRGDAILMPNPYETYEYAGAVTTLASGDFVVAWFRTSDRFGYEVYAQRFAADGSPVGSELLVGHTPILVGLVPEISAFTALESGGFAIAWQVSDPRIDISGKIYDADGTAAGEFQLSGGGPQIAAQAGGGFLAAWTDGNVKAQMFDEAGARVGPEILVSTNTDRVAGGTDIRVLPWGGFIVTWYEYIPFVGDGVNMAQVFDSAGGRIGAAFLFNDNPWADDTEIAVLASGSLAFAWSNDGFVDNDYELHVTAQIFRPLPDDGNDVLTGDAGSSIFDGGDGNDIVRAGAGDDRLFVSGDDSDVADGGTGADTLIVDYRDSTVRISMTVPTANPSGGHNGTIGGGGRRVDYKSIEAVVISTGSGDDIFQGLSGNDVMDGGAGNDVARGGAGNDRLIVTGPGADVAEGGTGLDTLVVDYRDSTVRISMTAPNANPVGGHNGTIGGGGRRVDYNGIEAVAISTGSGDDLLIGLGGDDVMDGGPGNDIARGGAGNDRLSVTGPGADIVEGGSGFDTLVLDYSDSAIRISMAAPTPNPAGGYNGTIGGGGRRTDFNSIEAFIITTGSGSDDIKGGSGNDRIRPGTGADVVTGDAGDDTLLFLASLDPSDFVRGGAGTDTLVLQGNYAAGLTLGDRLVEIEKVTFLSGKNTDHGELGTNRFDYVLTTHDSNFAAGVQAVINGIDLLPGEDFTFNGSAETNASFLIYGGKGVDTLTGGLGNDIFFFAIPAFAQGDKVNGGGGYDMLILRGDHDVDFSLPGMAGRITSIESIFLLSGSDAHYAPGPGGLYDYDLILADADLAAGAALTIDGSTLGANESVSVDGSRESDGSLNLLGGAGKDVLTGGAGADVLQGGLGLDELRGGGGADVFRYLSAADAPASIEAISDFTPGTDKIDLAGIDANSLAAGDQAFIWIGTAAFSGNGAASAGELRFLDISFRERYIEADMDGDGDRDFIIQVDLQGPTPLGAGDFIL